MSGFFTYVFQSFGAFEQVPDWSLVCQHPAYHSKDVERRPVQLAVVLNDSDKTVCDDRNINLYSHGILGCAPKREHSEMLFYPPKEEFHLTTLFVLQGNVLCLEREVVGQKRERPLKAWSIVYYPPQQGRILLLGLIAGSWPNIIIRNWFQHVKDFTYLSPWYFFTIPSKIRSGKSSTSRLYMYFPLFIQACWHFSTVRLITPDCLLCTFWPTDNPETYQHLPSQ